MQTKKIATTGLAILAIVAAVSLITASGSGNLVTSAFAVKKGTGSSSSSTSKKGTSANTGSSSSSSTGSKSKFIKCVTTISGSPTKAQVDNCWNQVFGGGSGLTLGGSFGGGSSSSGLTLGSSSASGKSSSGSSGHSSGSSSGTGT